MNKKIDIPKKPRACVPCQKRKVRCDASEVGTPCTRCIDKTRAGSCVPSSRPKIGQRQGGLSGRDTTYTQALVREVEEFTAPHSNARKQTVPEVTGNSGSATHALAPIIANRLAQQEDSGLLFTGRQSAPGSSTENVTADQASLYTAPRRFVVEYYKEFNPCTIVADSLDQPRRQGLVHTEDTQTLLQTAEEREVITLDDIDRQYFSQRRVHVLPPDTSCTLLIHLFFHHVAVHIPILNPDQFLTEYKQGICSTMLLNAVFMQAMPFFSGEDLQNSGYATSLAAQKEFFARARTLHDFSCERNDLNLLQSFILLGSYQHSLDPSRDSRFWFGNAVRLALQMGLHKSSIEDEVDPATYKVCRRIWWFLKQRDVFSVIAGLESSQKLIEEDSDTSAVTLQNFSDDTTTTQDAETSLYPPTRTAKLYFIELSALQKLGSNLLRLLRAPSPPPFPHTTTIHDLETALQTWRDTLPTDLRFSSIDRTSSADPKSQSCILTLHTIASGMQVLLYRTLLARGINSDDGVDIMIKLDAAIFEAMTVFRKAVSLDVLRFTPPFLNEFIAQLAAVQTEQRTRVGRHNDGSARALSAHADLCVLLAYFGEFEERWPAAVQYSHLFERVVGRGLDRGSSVGS